MGPIDAVVGPFLADKSAWERSRRVEVGEAWRRALDENRVLTCSIVRYEVLYSAREVTEFDAISERMAAYRDLPITAATHRAAHAAMRELAAAGPLHHRVPLSDLLIAAAAQEAGVPVVHCDAHFDRIATVLAVESRWLVDPAPPGG